MKRVPEPELMDEAAQARAYAAADFSEPHQAFVDGFREHFPRHRPRRVLDLGCGAADITIRFAHACADCELTGVDGAAVMLALAREAVARAGLTQRIRLVEARLPERALPERTFDTVISNSLLHHLADPQVLWNACAGYAVPGAAVWVVDLRRPDSREQAERLVREYSGAEPEILQRDFLNSLLAAYRLQEIVAQLARAGLARFQVEAVGDRHVIVHGHF
ncbi:MAG TPA: class I SAM-dependent methyltransferase [Candidatus Methylomirabilis sp.]|nr:class I SAM-dependent methyltransferase [Candidatus Methylomirabilis sp.]